MINQSEHAPLSSSQTILQEPLPPVYPMQKNKTNPTFIFIVLGIMFLGIGGVGGYYIATHAVPLIDTKTCTMEAKICPDGSSVGRSGPNCEFAPCPTIVDDQITNWKTYTDEKNGYEFKYPSNWFIETTDAGNNLLVNPDENVSFSVSRYPTQMDNSNMCWNKTNVTEIDLNGITTAKKEIFDGVNNAIDTSNTCESFSNKRYIRITWIKDTIPYLLAYHYDKRYEEKFSAILDQIISTLTFIENDLLIISTPTPSVPTGWKTYKFSTYGITMYAPPNWKSSSEDFPEENSSLIRFWQGDTQDTATIQLDIKTSWANTGDAPYLPKNYKVSNTISAVRVDPPPKEAQNLERYQTNVYFEHNDKTYVFECVHNWITEQVQLCNTMLETLQFVK